MTVDFISSKLSVAMSSAPERTAAAEAASDSVNVEAETRKHKRQEDEAHTAGTDGDAGKTDDEATQHVVKRKPSLPDDDAPSAKDSDESGSSSSEISLASDEEDDEKEQEAKTTSSMTTTGCKSFLMDSCCVAR